MEYRVAQIIHRANEAIQKTYHVIVLAAPGRRSTLSPSQAHATGRNREKRPGIEIPNPMEMAKLFLMEPAEVDAGSGRGAL